MQKTVTIIKWMILASLLVTAFVNCDGFELANTLNDELESGSSDVVSSDNCVLAPAQYRNPKGIDEVTSLINVLPKPLSIPCLIENLPQPLKVYSFESTGSAQPSVDSNNPRIFIFVNNLIVSVTPKGIGRELVEFSQVISSTESVKGEIKFPVVSELDVAAPYDSIRESFGTSCRVCHLGERSVSGFAGEAYASPILRPGSAGRQTALKMKLQTASCDDSDDPSRCKMLRSIFKNGNAQDANFP
ncbi:hypothetical protein B9G69_004875 [Bdellovibrio sp. SKB1291214]|uniref:hypothetical protein n=1 Tax=Bdellovibrio sp. SKB1291214 TaxID=1732569 RepID=UPI000B51594A|nr:hypothetical protein [Bdellovibrio sp. SKB1291214]UYL09907.1 hypothetical protein B9G69_004875 [Bdellovibrio sp. SKB1291214]